MQTTETLSIAPMIDWSNTHFRVLMRHLAPKAFLYTEMQTPGAIKHNAARALAYDPIEKPVVLQLGSSDENALVTSAKQAEASGFNEINLNLGCPSDRVQAGCFGAVLMNDPKTVAKCIHAMKQAVSIPITAKVRIGIDEQDSYTYFSTFVNQLVDAGADKLIVHARKAWLKGLSPKQNRSIPPIQYDYAYRIKQDFPEIPVVINGNISTVFEVQSHLQRVDGVMLGRLACQNPYEISVIHHVLFPEIPQTSRAGALQKYLTHVACAYQDGVPLSVLIKPLLNFTHGLPNAKRWREELAQAQRNKDIAFIDKLQNILAHMENQQQEKLSLLK